MRGPEKQHVQTRVAGEEGPNPDGLAGSAGSRAPGQARTTPRARRRDGGRSALRGVLKRRRPISGRPPARAAKPANAETLAGRLGLRRSPRSLRVPRRSTVVSATSRLPWPRRPSRSWVHDLPPVKLRTASVEGYTNRADAQRVRVRGLLQKLRRVVMSSVIVVLRRVGASRNRPTLIRNRDGPHCGCGRPRSGRGSSRA